MGKAKVKSTGLGLFNPADPAPLGKFTLISRLSVAYLILLVICRSSKKVFPNAGDLSQVPWQQPRMWG